MFWISTVIRMLCRQTHGLADLADDASFIKDLLGLSSFEMVLILP